MGMNPDRINSISKSRKALNNKMQGIAIWNYKIIKYRDVRLQKSVEEGRGEVTNIFLCHGKHFKLCLIGDGQLLILIKVMAWFGLVI